MQVPQTLLLGSHPEKQTFNVQYRPLLLVIKAMYIFKQSNWHNILQTRFKHFEYEFGTRTQAPSNQNAKNLKEYSDWLFFG
jgi:hypothetical protein